MKIGFLTDIDGYRAPIHPESIEKYSFDVHLEKNIFDYLNYANTSKDNVKTAPSSILVDVCFGIVTEIAYARPPAASTVVHA